MLCWARVFLSRTNSRPHDAETQCGPFGQGATNPRQGAGGFFGRKTQESGGGPRGAALDQSSRSSGLAPERSAWGAAARSAADHCGIKSATLVKGDAATAQSAQQSSKQDESAGPRECSAGWAWTPAIMCECESISMACSCMLASATGPSALEIDGPKATPNMASTASHTNDFRRYRRAVTRRLWAGIQGTRVQKFAVSVTRKLRGSTGWKWMSSMPPAGSPFSREA